MKHLIGSHSKKKRDFLMLVTVTAFAMAIVAFNWWVLLNTDQHMRDSLLQQARISAQSVNISFIKSLAGNRSDLIKPEYGKLFLQLSTIRHSSPDYEYVYLMGLNSQGKVYFIIDATEDEPELPGAVYKDASSELLQCFKTAQSFVEGPLPDEWGIWVSALVPVVDPLSGEVIAVLGIDSDASVWNENVLKLSANSMIFIILLFACILVALYYIRKEAVSVRPVLKRIMLPLSVIQLLLIAGTVGILYYQQQRDIAKSNLILQKKVSDDLRRSIEKHYNAISALQNVISVDENVKAAFRDSNADFFREHFFPLFTGMYKNNFAHLFSFYNSAGQQICNYNAEMNLPSADSEKMLAECIRIGKKFSGIAKNQAGSLMSMVILPIHDGSKIIGYFEVGVDLAVVFENIYRESGDEITVILDKEGVNQIEWENRIVPQDYPVNWYTFGNKVISFTTFNSNDSGIGPLVMQIRQGCTNTASFRLIDGNSWSILPVIICDYDGKHIGCMLIMRNVTFLKQENISFLLLVGFSGSLIFFGLWVLLFLLLRKTDENINEHLRIIRESENKHRTLFSSSPDAYFLVDMDLIVVDCNDAACRILKLSSFDIINRSVNNVLPELNTSGRFDRALQKMRRSRNSEKFPTNFEFFHILVDESKIWLEALASLISTNNDDMAFLSVRNITDQVNADNEIKSSLSLLNATLDSTADGLLVVDFNDHVVCWNHKFLELWNIPESLVLTKDDTSLLNFVTHQVVDQSGFLAKVRELYASQQMTCYDEIYLVDGRIFERYSQPQRKGDEIIGRVWSFRDITAKKNAENDLLQSERMAAVGTLAAGIAHNFNNLNTGIIGHLQILRNKENLSERGVKKLELILKTVKRSLSLTDSLLTFTGKRKGTRRNHHLDALINDTIALVHDEFVNDDININMQLEQGLIVFCNAGEICHVLFNLFTNARHAMIESEPKNLTIKCYKEALMGVVEVTDSGCGISEEFLRDVFTPFFTTKGEHASAGSIFSSVKGTGLGLSSSKAIVLNHNGEITVDSTVNQGTTFTVRLPLSEV